MVLERVAAWGFPDEVLQRVGALALIWGQFESNLETAVWALRGDSVAGTQPWTDKTSVSHWTKELGKPRPQFPLPTQQILQMAALAALDLMDYRHALVHGTMLPSPTMPTFIRNPGWHGEVRKRPSHDRMSTGICSIWRSIMRGRFAKWPLPCEWPATILRRSTTSAR
jgi:hypothetical protein